MATILLSAVGASLGAGFGGTVLGLSGAVLGRAVGASIGRAIDQRILGQGARAVETGRVDRMRIQTAGEGTPIARLWGQMRLAGHVIWASPLTETRHTQGGGKGAGPRVTEVGYRLSLALGLCEGPILGVGRVWADGEEISVDDLDLRIYHGTDTQLPDPVIAAIEGSEAPAYRGIAYAVIEELGLERWGNRVPQFSFEVLRAAKGGKGMSRQVEAVALIPATGEYALATTPVSFDLGLGETRVANRNLASGVTDFAQSLRGLRRELPRVGSVSLVVSWFGDDLRVNHCSIRPKVEARKPEGQEMPWRAGGIGRSSALEVARRDDRPIYGGTPADAAVIEALRALAAGGQRAVFYPFILMEQLAGNQRPDPWTNSGSQPVMPWRGRITSSVAFGRTGSPDGTIAAEAEVQGFFGAALADDFSRTGGKISYSGPDEWSYRRFILHYAHLCAEAGGIDSFLIGSEMVGLTRIRGANGSFPAVAELRRLARDVRTILGPSVKIGYAADWSEYFGYHPGNGDVHFHLDPLWADPDIDFVGIDNYMPLSDWRDGEDHLDAKWRRIDNPDYLRSNVAGGEGFDWYYARDADRDAQNRTPITDGAYAEPWIWRYKDIRNWWSSPHHDRIKGARQSQPTAWIPGSKPIWFTEMGCAAIDKGTNQPNKFLDAHSSESQLPYYSDGQRDDAIQAAYLRAMTEYWGNPAHNPPRAAFGRMAAGRMVDMTRAHVWCWDARPYPAFPARRDLWSDGGAWARGHWLNGRASAMPLADVVAEICLEAGVRHFDVAGLSGVVRGYAPGGLQTGRAALQPLMLAYGFDAVERNGVLRFTTRDARVDASITRDDLALADDVSGFEVVRASQAEIAGRIRLTHIEAGNDFSTVTAEAMLPDAEFAQVADSELPLVLTRAEGRAMAERWLSEAVIARDSLRFALPPSRSDIGPGDVVLVHEDRGHPKRWRIDRIERAGGQVLDAVRVEPGVYRAARASDDTVSLRPFTPAVPVWPVFLDLPLLRGDEAPYAPYLAATATPWPGQVSAWMSDQVQGGYRLNTQLARRGVIGRSETPLAAARAGVWDRGPALRVRLKGGGLESVTEAGLLAGANLLAIGDGSPEGWELIQFAQATLIAPDLWEISHRLRGQAGTDAFMPEVWPAGSIVVLLDGAARQVDLAPSARNQQRHWRIGPALRGPDDPSYRQIDMAFRGAGLRPLAPCHLHVEQRQITWVRRGRIAADGWDSPDIPLGETRERYLLRLLQAETLLSEVVAETPEWTIPPVLWQQIPPGSALIIEVAQLSDEFGPGPFVRRTINV